MIISALFSICTQMRAQNVLEVSQFCDIELHENVLEVDFLGHFKLLWDQGLRYFLFRIVLELESKLQTMC